jgi:Protein of unknown function (DUF3489)
MTSKSTAAANAAPAADSADPVKTQGPSEEHLKAFSEADKKLATSSPSPTGRKKACRAASADAPAAGGDSDVASKQPRQTKASVVEALLTREGGASLEALCEATGWQAHTCRAFLTGLRKKGKEVIRASDKDGKSIYLIAPGHSPAASHTDQQVEAESN